MLKKVIIAVSIILSVSGSLFAADADIKIPAGLGQSQFNDVTKELGLAIAYVPLAPAENLGIIGFDMGVELTAVDIDQDLFKKTKVIADPPSLIPFPKLHLQKGLPFGIDIGAIYSKVPTSNISIAGGEIKYAILTGTAVTPALAIRGSYTRLLGVSDLDLETFGADLSISKGFLFLTPYAGIGQVWIKANSDIVNLEQNTSKTRGFIGLKAAILPFSIVGEYDISEVPSYNLRLNISF